ncbi:MAG: DNA repair protein RecO [Eubacterium sp.]|jgi:DNA repair protein RecO (recombination protein O)
MYTSTEGIVFRQVRATGGRRILTIFSQKYGKISVGTSFSETNRKTRSSLALRPFTYARYELFKGRDYYDMNGGEVIKSFYGLSEDIDKFANASFVLELTDKVLPEGLPEPRLFNVLIDYLAAMERRRVSFDTLTIAYMVKMLDEVGMMPVLGPCASCGSSDVRFFSVPDGGMVCEDCKSKTSEKLTPDKVSDLIYSPDFDIVRTISFFREKPIRTFEKVALNEHDSEELLKILKNYISYHLDIGKLKSESIL